MLTRLAVIISEEKQVSSHCVVHLKVKQCYRSVIPQQNNNNHLYSKLTANIIAMPFKSTRSFNKWNDS